MLLRFLSSLGRLLDLEFASVVWADKVRIFKDKSFTAFWPAVSTLVLGNFKLVVLLRVLTCLTDSCLAHLATNDVARLSIHDLDCPDSLI